MSDLAGVFRLLNSSSNRQLDTYSILLDIEDWYSQHKQLIVENWYMYHGLHNLFLRKFKKETQEDFLKRVEAATIENHIKPILNLMASNLYQPADLKRYVNRDGSADERLNKFFNRKVWNFNHTASFDDFKALNLFVSGFSIVKRTLCDYRTNKPFESYIPNSEKAKFGFIKKDLVDSACCLPLPYIDENGEADLNKFSGLLIISDSNNYVGSKDVMKLLNRQYREVQIIEYIDDKIWIKFVRDKDKNEYKQVDVRIGKEVNRNPFEDVMIPFSLYINSDDPFSLEGTSDVDPIKPLNMQLNELSSGDFDVIRYHENPILLGTGGAQLPQDFVRTKDAVIDGLQGDGKFQYLTWDGHLDESRERQENLRRSMSFTSGVSLLSRGFMKDIGQIRSGPPLKALFTSDRALMARKATHFQKHEIEDMRADVKFWEKATETVPAFYNVDDSVTFHMEFPKDFLGLDDLLEAEIEAIKLGAGAISTEEVVKYYHPEWTEEQIKSEVKKINSAKQQSKVNAVTQSPDKKASQQ